MYEEVIDRRVARNETLGVQPPVQIRLLVEGEIDADTGYVVDVAILKQLAEELVVAQLDHRNLNLDVSWFRNRLPSAENIAVFCWEQLAPRIPRGRLALLRLWETPRNYVEYDGRENA